MIDYFTICSWMFYKGLSMRDIIVLAIIFRYSQDIQTFDPFCCLNEIAAAAKTHKADVERSIRKLESRGIIEWSKDRLGHPGYRVNPQH